MKEEKRMGVWPLPGGVDKYAETLEKCLAYVLNEEPKFEDLMKWFVTNFPGVKGGRSTQGYVYTVTDVLSLAEEGSGQRIHLTREGSEYVKTKDRDYLFRILDSRVAGISDILDILKSGPLGLSDLHGQLKSRLKKDWATENQTFFRVAWLMSLGKVKRVGHTYVLSSSALQPPPPPAPTERGTPKDWELDASLEKLTADLFAREKDTSNPDEFEEAVAQCFNFLGYDAKHIGGAGKADVLLTASLGTLSYKVVIDAKTSTSGMIDDARIDWLTLDDHRKKNDSKYVAVVGPNFESGRVKERAMRTGVTLISTHVLQEVMKLHQATPFDLIQLEDIFKEKGLPTNWRDLLEQYAIDSEANCNLLSSIIELLSSAGRELNVDQIEALLNAKGVQCTDQQVRLMMNFLSAPPLSLAKENEKAKYALRANPVTIGRKLQMLRNRIVS